MSLRHRVTAAAAAAAVPLALLIAPTPAAAAGVPPTPGITGNTPSSVKGSTRAAQFSDARSTVRTLRSMRRGDTAHIAMYSTTLGGNRDVDVAAAVRDADRDGVQIIWVTFQTKRHPVNGAMATIRGILNRSRVKGTRFVACSGACGGSGDTMHLKVAAYKISGRYYVQYSSGNWTTGGARTQWNRRDVVASAVLYRQARDKINRMTRDRRDTSCSTVRDRTLKITVVFMPCTSANPMLSALRAARCKRGDRVGLSMFMVGSSATSEVRELLRLKKAGCTVTVNGADGHWSNRRLRDLRDGGRVSKAYRGVRIPVSMSHGATEHEKNLWLHVHDSRGRRVDRDLSGSYTFGVLSRRYNDNHVMIREGAAATKWAERRHHQVRKHLRPVR